MYDWAPPDGVEVLIKWLSYLGETRDARPSGEVLPYRMVHRIDGGDDGITDSGEYSIHTFAAKKPEAQEEAMKTHRRLYALAGRFAGQQKVALDSGLIVVADDIETIEGPRWVQWDDRNSIHRYVGTYRVDFRFVAA
ncbi:hypothetical protein MHAEM_21631 [Mycolicibacterium phlei]|nr:hypothetical protein [Mycolicibacterium phlei]